MVHDSILNIEGRESMMVAADKYGHWGEDLFSVSQKKEKGKKRMQKSWMQM